MKEIIRRIKPEEHLLLFLDYDGTLVPIKKNPELAILHPLRRNSLKRLGKRVFLCIVSGRSLAEIQRLVAVKDIAYIGNHGLEISYGQRRWVHPEARRIRPILRDVLKRIHHKTKDFPGVLIEDKGVTGTIHYRLLDSALWNPLKEIIGKEVELRSRELKMTEGKRVFEIRPNVEWDKGKGVQQLGGWLAPKEMPLGIYIGDDQTDEDAFKVFERDAITILVGQRKNTHAKFRLADVNQVWRLLRALLPLVS
jgi:trehalose-phosphatase